MPISRSDQLCNSNHIKGQRQSGNRSEGVCNQVREISVLEMPRTGIEIFCDSLPRDGWRKTLPINVIDRFLALDHVKTSICKRHESADSD